MAACRGCVLFLLWCVFVRKGNEIMFGDQGLRFLFWPRVFARWHSGKAVASMGTAWKVGGEISELDTTRSQGPTRPISYTLCYVV